MRFTMELQDVAEMAQHGLTLAEPQRSAPGFWDKAHAICGREQHTDPSVAATLVQILTLSEEFEEALLRRGLDPRDAGNREFLLIGRRNRDGYVLLVADGALL